DPTDDGKSDGGGEYDDGKSDGGGEDDDGKSNGGGEDDDGKSDGGGEDDEGKSDVLVRSSPGESSSEGLESRSKSAPNEIDMDDLDPDDELLETPLTSPFLDLDDGEVLNELE
ncbi:hypothetical protein Tco_1411156, partial [Tanacetum coccineum]